MNFFERYLQPACSQPQDISVTPESSAFSQYSLQYLLSFSAIHSQTPCAHFLLSAINPPCFSFDSNHWGLSAMLEPRLRLVKHLEFALSSSLACNGSLKAELRTLS